MRRIFFRHSASFFGASNGSLKLFRIFKVDDSKLHLSPPFVKNNLFDLQESRKTIDFLFSGSFLNRKNPFFAIQVAALTSKKLKREITLNILGQGPLEQELRSFVTTVNDLVDIRFLGYLTQKELPSIYAQSRIFLFPTKYDCWGLVANEACAAGLPVLISLYAGAASELVINEVNGYVLELDVDTWSEAAVHLLSNEHVYSNFSQQSRQLVSSYTFEIAAAGLAAAIRQAAAKQGQR